jgi:hypothetical protein
MVGFSGISRTRDSISNTCTHRYHIGSPTIVAAFTRTRIDRGYMKCCSLLSRNLSLLEGPILTRSAIARPAMATWIDDCLEVLASKPAWGYRGDGLAYTEPTALSALALVAYGRMAEALPQLRWLAEHQAEDGNVDLGMGQKAPHWPTGWSVLAWRTAVETGEASFQPFEKNAAKGVGAILKSKGAAVPRSDQLGHDTTLVGWAWVDGTHSWIEPTAWNVLALKSAGHAGHIRTRDGVKLLIDRLLPDGGCNYGNTSVLGQVLRPHVQPTGLALLALAGETDDSGRIAASVKYLQQELSADTAAASLAYGVMGCAAHEVDLPDAPQWLEAAQRRVKANSDGLRLALLCLAARGQDSPFIRTIQQTATP